MIHSVVRRASTDSHLFFKPLRYRLGLLTVAGRLPTSKRFGFPAYHVTVNGAFPWSLRLLVGQALIFWLPSVRLQFTTIKKSEPPNHVLPSPIGVRCFVLVAGYSFSRPRSLIVVPVTIPAWLLPQRIFIHYGLPFIGRSIGFCYGSGCLPVSAGWLSTLDGNISQSSA